jgi:hypothetical protein
MVYLNVSNIAPSMAARGDAVRRAQFERRKTLYGEVLTQAEFESFERTFQQFDLDGSGDLGRHELAAVLKSLEPQSLAPSSVSTLWAQRTALSVRLVQISRVTHDDKSEKDDSISLGVRGLAAVSFALRDL